LQHLGGHSNNTWHSRSCHQIPQGKERGGASQSVTWQCIPNFEQYFCISVSFFDGKRQLFGKIKMTRHTFWYVLMWRHKKKTFLPAKKWGRSNFGVSTNNLPFVLICRRILDRQKMLSIKQRRISVSRQSIIWHRIFFLVDRKNLVFYIKKKGTCQPQRFQHFSQILVTFKAIWQQNSELEADVRWPLN